MRFPLKNSFRWLRITNNGVLDKLEKPRETDKPQNGESQQKIFEQRNFLQNPYRENESDLIFVLNHLRQPKCCKKSRYFVKICWINPVFCNQNIT